MTTHEGGCLCGNVRFRVTAAALDSGYCHCRMCQRNSGAPVVAWATFPMSGFAWIAGTAAEYPSSTNAKRHFCASCGSYMVFANSQTPAEISVNIGSFDDPEAFPPRKHIFIESRISWFHTDDGLPQEVGYGAGGNLWRR